MATGRPLFRGSSDKDQLAKIFKVLGSPDKTQYPAIDKLPEYKVIEGWQKYKAMDLRNIVARLDRNGLHLLQVLCWHPHTSTPRRSAL